MSMISDCILEKDSFKIQSELVNRGRDCFIFTYYFDFIVSMVFLSPFSPFRKKYLLGNLVLISLATKGILQIDRNSEKKYINNLFVRVEKRMGFCLQYMNDNCFRLGIFPTQLPRPIETFNPLEEGRREYPRPTEIFSPLEEMGREYEKKNYIDTQIPDSIELSERKSEV